MSSTVKRASAKDPAGLRPELHQPRWDNVLEDAAQAPTILIVDDIDLNRAFYDFAERSDAKLAMVCLSEPLEPDVCRLRYENSGLFGIMLKPG